MLINMILDQMFMFILLVAVSLLQHVNCIGISNQYLSLEFCEKYGVLKDFRTKDTDLLNVKDQKVLDLLPVWEIQFVHQSGLVKIDSAGKQFRGELSEDGTLLTMEWIVNVPTAEISATKSNSSYLLSATVSVTLTVSLEPSSQVSEWNLQTRLIASPSPKETAGIAIWQGSIIIPTTAGSDPLNGELFYPGGYGHRFQNPFSSTGGKVSGVYPSGGASMQFMAAVNENQEGYSEASATTRASYSGLYVAALDVQGFVKTFEYTTLYYRLANRNEAGAEAAIDGKTSKHRENKIHGGRTELWVAADEEKANISSSIPADEKMDSTASPRIAFLSITVVADNAGVPWTTTAATAGTSGSTGTGGTGDGWKMPYSVGVGVVTRVSETAGSPLWYQAANIYKTFLQSASAPWMQQKLSSRIPDWYRNNAIWLNTHWQCYDVFNRTGGDPVVVRDTVTKIAQLLREPSLILHWYEWQQGPDPRPERRYLFDTHYPDYLPPRRNYKQVVTDLLSISPQLEQEHEQRGGEKRDRYRVYTVPYINGRIFDIASDSFIQDNGAAVCTKAYTSPQLVDEDNATATGPGISLESYGSDATFCVASPHSAYWQDKITNTTMELLEEWVSAGVYIDQIGAAHPDLCWDAYMQHTLGGGTYWTNGYTQLLQQIDLRKQHRMKSSRSSGSIETPTSKRHGRANTAAAANANAHANADADGPVIITEDCAEPYMGLLQGNLVLTTFRTSLAMGRSDTSRPQTFRSIAPAYPVVYGGYFMGIGAEWFVSDWEDDNWFCAKLATTFVVGTQMGWFSLIGVTDPAYDQKCGPMGTAELLLDPHRAGLTTYLRLLAAVRRQEGVVGYLVEGAMTRPPVLRPAPPVFPQAPGSVGGGLPQLDYDSVSRASWYRHFKHPTVTATTTTTPAMPSAARGDKEQQQQQQQQQAEERDIGGSVLTILTNNMDSSFGNYTGKLLLPLSALEEQMLLSKRTTAEAEEEEEEESLQLSIRCSLMMLDSVTADVRVVHHASTVSTSSSRRKTEESDRERDYEETWIDVDIPPRSVLLIEYSLL
mmetsp:Transcript_13392/g.22430  ORF Transcript_13392/g.22430 Transcript_13392/m.22430 type:complete len:1054 (+) Transcript_13392:30-3191(+)